MNPHRIEHRVQLRAPRARVWQALTDAREFGAWFRVRLDNGFAPGQRTTGRITYPGYEHIAFEVAVERMEPPRFLSWRWHPYAIDPAVDYSAEPPTRVEFNLEESEGGTLLQVTESGFEHIPTARRDEAQRMNDGGWAEQMNNIREYL